MIDIYAKIYIKKGKGWSIIRFFKLVKESGVLFWEDGDLPSSSDIIVSIYLPDKSRLINLDTESKHIPFHRITFDQEEFEKAMELL